MEDNPKVNNRAKSGYIANMVIHAIFLYVIFQIRSWVTFLTDGSEAIIWMLAISYAATILLNLIYIFYYRSWFKSLSQLALNVYNIIIFYTLIKIFPFELDDNYLLIARVIIYVALFGTAIGAVVELGKFIRAIANDED